MSEVKRIVRIKPYPISLLLFIKENSPPVRSKILKLTDIGFIALVPERLFLKLSESVRIEFDLPASHETVHADVKVIKLYDRITAAGVREHLVEMHFVHIDVAMKKAVKSFLIRIGQIK